MYYYILAFLVIMVLYMFYNQEIDYYKQKVMRTSQAGYVKNITDYYRYHMI